MHKNQKGFTVFEGIIIVVALIAIGAAGYFAYQARQDKTDYSVNTPHKADQTPGPASEKTGLITGTASYPSSGLPDDEQVCAVPTSGGSAICTKVAGKAVYKLTVPAGKYYVYSTAENELKGYKAYYNQYSKCGNSVDCPDSGHSQYIEVNVNAGSTVSNVDPGDWYNI